MAEYELTLFVSGASDFSARAIADAKRVCDASLGERYKLEIVDVHEDAAAAYGSGVFATPTLVKSRPPPVRQLVGNLSQAERVLAALDIPVPGNPPVAVG
jgi:circadian clock protein KaiB